MTIDLKDRPVARAVRRGPPGPPGLPGVDPGGAAMSSFVMKNGVLTFSVSGGALTVAIKTNLGADPSPADPVFVNFRTAGTASFVIESATSFVIANGSTLGVSANVAFRLAFVAFLDSGSIFRMGVYNGRSGSDLYFPTAPTASSTAEGTGAADLAQTFYTAVAVTNKPYAVLGFASWAGASALAVPGVWANVPSSDELFGPGVRLPGETYRLSPVAIDRSQVTNATNAYVNTNTTLTLTPDNAEDAIDIYVSGQLGQTTDNYYAQAQILNGGTQLGVAADVLFVGAPGLTALIVPASMAARDFPNSVAAQTYVVGVKSANAANTPGGLAVWAGTGLSGQAGACMGAALIRG